MTSNIALFSVLFLAVIVAVAFWRKCNIGILAIGPGNIPSGNLMTVVAVTLAVDKGLLLFCVVPNALKDTDVRTTPAAHTDVGVHCGNECFLPVNLQWFHPFAHHSCGHPDG